MVTEMQSILAAQCEQRIENSHSLIVAHPSVLCRTVPLWMRELQAEKGREVGEGWTKEIQKNTQGGETLWSMTKSEIKAPFPFPVGPVSACVQLAHLYPFVLNIKGSRGTLTFQ